MIEPIEPLSLFMGWKAGNWVARQRGKKVEEEKTPVAYLYNGVILPDINAVWTDEVRAKFPYAFMSKVPSFGVAVAFVTSFEVYKDGNKFLSKTAGELGSALYTPRVFDWGAVGGVTEVKANDVLVDFDRGPQLIEPYFWTSHDILNSDGTIYLAASEPVPVYA